MFVQRILYQTKEQIRIVLHISRASAAPAVHHNFCSFQFFSIRHSWNTVLSFWGISLSFFPPVCALFSFKWQNLLVTFVKISWARCWASLILKGNRIYCDLITTECTNTHVRNAHECFFWVCIAQTMRYQFPWSVYLCFFTPISMWKLYSVCKSEQSCWCFICLYKHKHCGHKFCNVQQINATSGSFRWHIFSILSVNTLSMWL